MKRQESLKKRKMRQTGMLGGAKGVCVGLGGGGGMKAMLQFE